MIDLSPQDLATVKDLVAAHFPKVEVRVFGSRYRWTAKDYSDLDIVLVGEEKLDWQAVGRLGEALAESDLPVRVDVLDWHAISPEFQRVIEQGYAVIQERRLGASSGKWRQLKVGQLCKSVSVTHRFNRDQLVFLNTGDIDKGKFLHRDYSDVNRMPGQARKSIQQGDILFSEIRPANGRFAFVDFDADDYVVSTKLMVIRSHEQILPRYLYHFLTNRSTTDWLQYLAESRSGTFPQITFDQVADLDIKLPSLLEQSTIVAFIDSLDDKIELNRQTNATLEAMAQALFKEWFVDFNFPGATGEMQESELGEIPVGWRVGKLGSEGDFKNGINYSRDENGDTEFCIVNVRDVVANKFISKQNLDTIRIDQNKAIPYLLKANDILLVRSASPGETAILLKHENGIIYSGFTIRYRLTNKVYFLYLFFIFQSLKNVFNGLSNGTTLKNINQGMLNPYQIVFPSETIMRDFNRRIESIFQIIENNNQNSRTLVTTSDTLLPKLMRGEIDV